MTKKELAEVLADHRKWRAGDGGKRADLQDAYLQRANLQDANLQGANLQRAYLQRANLQDANLQDANLRGAYLQDANLRGAKGGSLTIARTRTLPEGTLIGWKKCCDGVLVKLEVPAEAKRSHAFDRKCRAEFVKVLEVIGADEGVSQHTPDTVYCVGETVRCDKWDEDWMTECSGGIHFYITREEAEAW